MIAWLYRTLRVFEMCTTIGSSPELFESSEVGVVPQRDTTIGGVFLNAKLAKHSTICKFCFHHLEPQKPHGSHIYSSS